MLREGEGFIADLLWRRRRPIMEMMGSMRVFLLSIAKS
jgi:hypothetical protein